MNATISSQKASIPLLPISRLGFSSVFSITQPSELLGGVVGGRKEQKLATNRMMARSMIVASSDTIAPRARSNQRASL